MLYNVVLSCAVKGNTQSKAAKSDIGKGERGKTAEVQKGIEQVSAAKARKAEEEAKEEVELSNGEEEDKEVPEKMSSRGNRRKGKRSRPA